MKKNILTPITITMLAVISFTSCKKQLTFTPTNGLTVDQAYSTPLGYKQGLAKVYGAFALTGNTGAYGQQDINNVDEGLSDFVRMFWITQELSTDEAIPNASWINNTDAGLQDFHNLNWGAGNPLLEDLYVRSTYQILLCNEFMRQCSDANLSSRGITGASADTIKNYIPEVRFLRAFQYWVLMDEFGNPSFATEKDAVGGGLPPQIKRADLFNYVTSELLDISTSLPAPRANEYGRADQAAAWALLARLYLNAEVYTGTPKYDSAIIYSQKVINAGYSLETNYRWLLLNDNYLCTNEFVFTINYDGQNSKSYGGPGYVLWTGSGPGEPDTLTGISAGGWAGNRTVSTLPNLFPDYTGAIDKRSMFFTDGHTIDIVDRSSWYDGFAVTKFRNINRNGSFGVQTAGSGINGTGVGIDMPLFRLAEQYLIYAEATLRGGTGGSSATAVSYFNLLRERAYGNTNGNVSSISLQDVLDERGRELYWEGFRRTDLIRYKLFTSSAYLWPWKANIANGAGVDDHFNLFPIPAPELSANSNLHQNTGY